MGWIADQQPAELLWRHTDNCRRHTIDGESIHFRQGTLGELVVPNVVGHDSDTWRATTVIRRLDEPTRKRMYPEHRETVARDGQCRALCRGAGNVNAREWRDKATHIRKDSCVTYPSHHARGQSARAPRSIGQREADELRRIRHLQ